MPDLTVTPNGRHRRQRERPGPPDAVDAWPPAWRTLATAWARRGARCKWETLLALAGGAGFETAHDLLESLLTGGWIRVEEVWREGRWQPLWIGFRDLSGLRAALGLPDPGARLAALEQARIDLLATLVRWSDAPERPDQATRRDFAQFARGDTKGITSAEWDWLAARVDLAAHGIGDHAPLLCIAAPLTLQLPRGRLNLDAAPDFLALPPTTFDAAESAQGDLIGWTLIENRTSFERVARARATGEGVLWLPGFAPGWWQSAVARLLRLAPAPARIACDPDPAGIEIAMHAGAIWQAAGLDWQPWRMGESDLVRLCHRKPLTSHDRQRLLALGELPLPAPLAELARRMMAMDEKGEQEGLL